MSGFDIKKLADFFPKKTKGTTGLTFCERGAAAELSTKHIRRVSGDGTFPRGIDNVITLCATAVDRDTSVITSLFEMERIRSRSTPFDNICQPCLREARLILDPVKAHPC